MLITYKTDLQIDIINGRCLFVQVRPYITPFAFEGEANSGDSAQITCYVGKGDTPLSISWNFHGRELSSHLGIRTQKIGDRTSLLTLSSVMAGHAGNYTCTAINMAGVANHTTTLFVNGIFLKLFFILLLEVD